MRGLYLADTDCSPGVIFTGTGHPQTILFKNWRKCATEDDKCFQPVVYSTLQQWNCKQIKIQGDLNARKTKSKKKSSNLIFFKTFLLSHLTIANNYLETNKSKINDLFHSK